MTPSFFRLKVGRELPVEADRIINTFVELIIDLSWIAYSTHL